jgi:hypothetical protein
LSPGKFIVMSCGSGSGNAYFWDDICYNPNAALFTPNFSSCTSANGALRAKRELYIKSPDSICGMTIPLKWQGDFALDSIGRTDATTLNWEYWDATIDNDAKTVLIGGARTQATAVPPGDSQLVAVLYFHPTVPIATADSTELIIDTTTLGGPESALAFADCSAQAFTYVPDVNFGKAIYYGYMAGDANGDKKVNIGDAVFMINRVFRGGPAPVPLNAGDANGDGHANVGDVVYLINFVFKHGPAPLCGRITGAFMACGSCGAQHIGLFKAPAVSIRVKYAPELTTIETATPIDIYGLQLEFAGGQEIKPVNLVENTQLYSGIVEGKATVGLLDINGIGHIPAGTTTNLEIPGNVTLISAIGVDEKGNAFDIAVAPATKAETLPKSYALSQNRPNPFNPVTEISFDLPTATDVSLEIYNITGQKVTTLVQGVLQAGHHSYLWDGSGVASGIYLYRLQAGEFTATRKMVLMK